MSEAAAKPADTTGAEEVRWDLGDLYSDIDDAALERDLGLLLERAKSFEASFRGQLKDKLG